MTDIILVLILAAAFAIGFFAVDRFGRFADENYKGDDDGTEEEKNGKQDDSVL